MSRYLSILVSVLALSLTALALPQSAHNHAVATMNANKTRIEAHRTNTVAFNSPRQIHNADYGSGGGPSGNPGNPPPQMSSAPSPSTPTTYGGDDHTASPDRPTDYVSQSTAGQKRAYAKPYPTPAHAIY